MASKRRFEGYFQLDHRASPGITEEVANAAGLPLNAGRGLFEASTYTCSHCQVVVILNPNRTRDRAYCSKCNHYICDRCGAVMAHTGKCVPFKQIVEIAQANGDKEHGESSS